MSNVILNVAEKNSIAKEITKFLSSGNYEKSFSASKFNPVFKFRCNLRSEYHEMIFTSVSGHLFNLNFPKHCSTWNLNTNHLLFDAPVENSVPSNSTYVVRNLEKLAPKCRKLIIWTDCDREGEFIGNSIAEVCKSSNRNISVLRARFSDVSSHSVRNAIENLVNINQNQVEAVRCRMEADLRLGAVFTRAQSLAIKLNEKNLLSYGPCQFPTLGLVVKRYEEIVNFKSERFYFLRVELAHPEGRVEFSWDRNHLFDETICKSLYDVCVEANLARVEKVTKKDVKKFRPYPMDTVQMEKLAANYLNLSAKKTMSISEGLYNKGFISYPRTDTTQFSNGMDFNLLVSKQKNSPIWGAYASELLNSSMRPSRGNKNDQAHPPIHPIKSGDELTGVDKQLYEIIVRHFLACLSKDALGIETSVTISVDKEKFHATGLVITERNFLDIYPYLTWTESFVPLFEEGSTFKPKISMNTGDTQPPNLLTEADLISLMVQYGIGTDATHAEHIDKILTREYAVKKGQLYMPTPLGYSLIKGYETIGLNFLYSPVLRAAFEKRLEKICEGQDNCDSVLTDIIGKCKEIYRFFETNMNVLCEVVKDYTSGDKLLKDIPKANGRPGNGPRVSKCGLCGGLGHNRLRCPNSRT